jgi:hypothetical protein
VTAASGIRLLLVATTVAIFALFPVSSSASEKGQEEPGEATTASEEPRIFDPQGPRLIYPNRLGSSTLRCSRR